MKNCIKCNIEKELKEFNKQDSTKDNHTNICKSCKREYDRKLYRIKNIEKNKAKEKQKREKERQEKERKEKIKNTIVENLPNEQWKDIKGFEGLYQISSHGRVKSIKVGEKLLSQFKTQNGYLQATLSKKGKQSKPYIHQLVINAFTWDDPPPNKTEVHHFDHDRTNNYIGNLFWVTSQENKWHNRMYYAMINGITVDINGYPIGSKVGENQ